MAAAVRQTDDDAIDPLLAHEPIDVVHVAEDVVLADEDVVVAILDKADQAVGEILARANLLGEAAGRQSGAEDQHTFIEMGIVGDMVEGDAPRQHRDDEHAQGGDERPGIENQRRRGDARRGQDDRGGAGRLQQADHQLAVRMDDVQVVEVVVVETQLAQRRDQRDLPEHRADGVWSVGRERAVQARRQRHRPRDEHHLEGEDRQSPD